MQVYSDMQCENLNVEYASCAVVRTDSDGVRTLHFINFVRTGSGIRKISSMQGNKNDYLKGIFYGF